MDLGNMFVLMIFGDKFDMKESYARLTDSV